jgi:hypothetical protein
MGEYFDDIGHALNSDAQLAGQPAQKLTFQATVKSTNNPVAGECFVLVHQGYSYAFLTWSAQTDLARSRKDFDAVRQGFALLEERRDWKEKRPKPRDFPGTKAEYVLTDTEGLWETQNAADFDERTDIALIAYERDEYRKHVGKAAFAWVLVLPPAGDAQAGLAAALTNLEERQKKEYPETVVEKVGEERAEPIGTAQGRVALLNVKNSEARNRFVLLATVSTPKALIVFHGECDWNKRSRKIKLDDESGDTKASKEDEEKAKWETDFRQLLKSFRLGKAKDSASTS